MKAKKNFENCKVLPKLYYIIFLFFLFFFSLSLPPSFSLSLSLSVFVASFQPTPPPLTLQLCFLKQRNLLLLLKYTTRWGLREREGRESNITTIGIFSKLPNHSIDNEEFKAHSCWCFLLPHGVAIKGSSATWGQRAFPALQRPCWFRFSGTCFTWNKPPGKISSHSSE